MKNAKYIIWTVTEIVYIWPWNLNLEYIAHKMYIVIMYIGSITVFVWLIDEYWIEKHSEEKERKFKRC